MRRATSAGGAALAASAIAVVCLAGCANGETFGRRDAGVPLDAPAFALDAGPDARAAPDAAALDARPVDAPVPDAGPLDAGRADAGPADAGRDAGGGAGALDPRLDTPPASAPPCATPGASCTAPDGPGVCRFFSETEGRCESCTSCGNLGAACTDGTGCDILFACFAGRCTNICPLGTFYCGPVEDCLDVGHPTHGVCRP